MSKFTQVSSSIRPSFCGFTSAVGLALVLGCSASPGNKAMETSGGSEGADESSESGSKEPKSVDDDESSGSVEDSEVSPDDDDDDDDTTGDDDDDDDDDDDTTGDDDDDDDDDDDTTGDDDDDDDTTSTTGDDDDDETTSSTGDDDDDDDDPMPWFTFFTTSQEGIVSVSTDKQKGLGGDLGGLKGADEICTKLAKVGNPGDTKTWVAFLSATKGARNGGPVHAIERVGKGPWQDFNKRVMAMDVDGLRPGQNGRPSGADPQLAKMFTDEKGRLVSPDITKIDNHDTLTGSDRNGRLPSSSTLRDTCQDWTSKDAAANGQPIIGHAWPRQGGSGPQWINDHKAGGCGAGMSTKPGGGDGTKTVGSGGGYGGFYCFAVSD